MTHLRTIALGRYLPGLLGFGLYAVASTIAGAAGSATDEWPCYGHDSGGMRYSPLREINRENVAQLKVAWVFHTGDISDGKGHRKRSGFETTPILVKGTLYLTTPFNRVIALNPETGKQLWAYDPKTELILSSGLLISKRAGKSGKRSFPPAARRRP